MKAPRLQPGDEIETAIWLSGNETAEVRAQYEADVAGEIRRAAAESQMLVSPVKFTEKRPGEDRVPDVPKHVSGPNVRLLVAEAKVLCPAPTILPPRSFLLDLDVVDLARLRAITRRVHRQRNPKAPALTDEACDEIIEAIGPAAAIDAVRQAVDSGAVH